METIHPSLNVSRDTIAAFCRKWQIIEFALFGSAARGELRPESDIDVMVQFGAGEAWSLLDLARMKLELEAMLGRTVDLMEKGTVRNPFRQRTIARDLTVLYAA
ncbi:MAG: nucleotidyltransferase family protein [Chloroflexota bacterium]|nr:nucleotidyltransferase family protein [Chloroflexota bacterium]